MPNEQQLSEVLGEFARTMLLDFPIQAILDRLVSRIVDVLPVSAAGITLISPGLNLHYVSASSESALRFERLQTALSEGPCVLAYETGQAVLVEDLRNDRRFPKFAPLALDAGLVAVYTFPLHHGRRQLGALNLYREEVGPLGDAALEAAQTLADVAAAYLLNAQAREELNEASQQSRDLALHDALTQLPNRVLLMERLDHAVLRARRSGKVAAVLFVDLDRFKLVNDLYGHKVGDDLLIAVAGRITGALRSGDTLARLSGDEFVILCEDLNEASEVDVIAARVVAAVAVPFIVAGHELNVTASMGIAFSGRGDQLSEQILEDADAAMYQAKRDGGAHHQIVDLRELHVADERASLERDLHGARARGEMRALYQPIVSTAAGLVVGFEALLRWDHPSLGVVMPSLLIPIIEQSGQMSDIGGWILEEACAERCGWEHLDPGAHLTISINVSARQLMAPGFVSLVSSALAKRETDPRLVTLETTESVFVEDSARALVIFDELKLLGVTLALDDFGTGYSSLSYLQRFPIDIVKIDKAFIDDLRAAPASAAIVFAIIELAHHLGMTVVAEGVETREQHQQLISLGCDFCQGFYFAEPLSNHDAHSLILATRGSGTAQLPAAGLGPTS
jgi:diguanylate cyclase (GGDEF)-like protein